MDERTFLERRRPEWESLAALLDKVAGQGLKSLSGAELRSLGSLYRHVTADLAYARANFIDESLVQYLNGLAGRAHGLLYASTPKKGGSIGKFLLYSFPILCRKHRNYIVAAAAIMIVIGILAAATILLSWSRPEDYIPKQLLDYNFPDDQALHGGVPATFSAQLMTHNIRVSLIAFAGGLTGGVLTVWILMQTGAMLGAFMASPPKFLNGPLDAIAYIFPHGIIELAAIVIAAGAGLMIGGSLISPGNISRQDSLRKASRDALPLMAGVVVMLIIAGIIESFVARSLIPRSLKLSIAAFSAVTLAFYFGFAGRSSEESHSDDSSDAENNND